MKRVTTHRLRTAALRGKCCPGLRVTQAGQGKTLPLEGANTVVPGQGLHPLHTIAALAKNVLETEILRPTQTF